MKRIGLAALIMLAFTTILAAGEPKELKAAKKEFAQIAHPDEAARQSYVLTLADLRQKLAESKGNWKAVDAELRQHPAPKHPDSADLTKALVGAWTSPRHGFLYRDDGTWTTLPSDPGNVEGKWRIEGNRFFATYFAPAGSQETIKYTIILLADENFIFTDGDYVFFDNKKK